MSIDLRELTYERIPTPPGFERITWDEAIRRKEESGTGEIIVWALGVKRASDGVIWPTAFGPYRVLERNVFQVMPTTIAGRRERKGRKKPIYETISELNERLLIRQTSTHKPGEKEDDGTLA